MPTLVLLPGMDGTGVLFADFAAAMRPEFRPIVVAYPNDPKLGYPELELLARAALPHDQPFILLGESFSGPIAISIAPSNPPGLLGVILCCTFARSPHPLLALATAAIKPLPAALVPAFIQHRNLFGRFDSPRLRAQLVEVRGLVSANTLKSRLESVAHADVSDALRRVTVPIFDLRAKRDRVVSRASGDYIRKIRPDAKIADLDAPHLLLQTVPQEAWSVIKNFATECIKTAGESNS
ncbi:MAG TPA: alpha/beta hydrolase [Candidatus Acidoferrales bacterium]|nr:alpha/beta hydrolase [Candidatus Acidoferrales bacterium]